MFLLHSGAFLAHFAQCKASAKQQVNSMIDAIYAKVMLDLELWLNKHQSNDSVHALALNHNEPTGQMQSSDLFTPHVPQSNCHQTDSITPRSSFLSVKNEICNEIEVDCRVPQHDSIELASFHKKSLMIRDGETIFNAQQYHSQSLDNSQISSANIEPALNSIAHSITDPLNVQFEPQLNDHSINSSSSAHESTLISSTSTDASLPNTEIQQQPHFQQLVHIKHNKFDDEDECDCEECVHGGIEVKEEDDDDGSDNIQWIEDDAVDEESSPPVKRPKRSTTQNQINAQATDETQPNQVNDKQIITVHLRCPELGCPETFAETELNNHLMDEHLIGPNRCVVKDCKQSFDNSRILSEHIKQVHQGITKWHCNKCSKHFAKYLNLYNHTFQYHQLGHFECSFPSCAFTGEYRKKVYDHYEYVHKQKPELMCQHSGCSYRTNRSTRLKAHERVHLGIKPYRCKWPNCDYSSTSRNNAMMHIKAHFNSSSSDVVLPGKPMDYLDVIHSLL